MKAIAVATRVRVAILPLLMLLAPAGTAARAADTAATDWTFPTTLTADELSALCGPEASCVEQWLRADLRHDAAIDGLRGTVDIGVDCWLRDPEALAWWARVQKTSGPLMRCDRLEIQVWSPSADKPRTVKDKDLAWRGELGGGNGIVELDVTDYLAVIPGLRIGDRLRVVWHWEYSAAHGLPIVTLRAPGAGVQTTVQISAPADQTITYACVGPDSLAARVDHEHAVVGTKQTHRWAYRERRASAGPAERTANTAADESTSLSLVPHLAVGGATAPAGGAPATFVAAPGWVEAAKAYREHIASLLEPTPAITDQARSLCTGEQTTAARIAALHAHVQAATRYLGLFNGRGGIIPAAPDATRARGYGDCKGLSAYFIALCRAAGLTAWPALALAGDRGHIAADQPNLAQFNHFIAWVDDGQGGCWVDPTLEDIPAGMLIPEVALEPVLAMQPGSEGLVRIPHAVWDPGERRIEVAGTVDQALRLSGSVTLTASGAGAARLEHALAGGSDRRRNEARLCESLLAAPLRTSALAATAADSAAAPAVWRRSFRGARPLPGGSGRLFVPAEIAPVAELDEAVTRSSAAIDPRRLPDRHESWRLELPAGWRLVAADSIVVAEPGLTWRREVRQVDGRLELERRIDWADTAITAAQASRIAEALGAIARRERNPLQLIRNEP